MPIVNSRVVAYLVAAEEAAAKLPSQAKITRHAPPGTFKGTDAKTIARRVLKFENDDVKRAIRSVTYYLNRAGAKLGNRAAVKSAGDILRNHFRLTKGK